MLALTGVTYLNWMSKVISSKLLGPLVFWYCLGTKCRRLEGRSFSFQCAATVQRYDSVLCAVFHTTLCIITVMIDTLYSISTPANHAVQNFILCGSLASPLLLITALLFHMLIISLMAFTAVLVHVVVQTFRTNR